MRQELDNTAGFNWQGWNDAANYCYTNKVNLEEGLTWADKAIQNNENFTDLLTRAEILGALGRKDEASKALEKAINSPSATAIQIHMYGRQLLNQGQKEDAVKVWQLNAKNHPKAWPVNFGLARGYSAMGDYKTALKYAKQALEEAPDEANKSNVKNAIAKLEKSQDIN
jgi:tetratricopeptide (TPR) repeat protein